MLAWIASESLRKTKSESQEVPLSSLNEQQPRTARPVMGASPSNYSEWNIDDKWSSQEWKSGEMLGARTGRPVGGQQFTQDIDKFVIDDDDIDSDTVTESNFSPKSRLFLNRVNDRLRKILDHSSIDAMQDIDKLSIIFGIRALDLWDLIVLVLGNTTPNHDRTGQPVVGRNTSRVPSQQSRGMNNVLNNVDRVPSNVQFSHQEALLYVFQDNEAVIKMIIK